MYSEEKFSRFDVRRSPPDPLTHSTSTASPVSGSVSEYFDDVLPPPVFVMRRSCPSRFDRYTSRPTGSSPAAVSSSHK